MERGLEVRRDRQWLPIVPQAGLVLATDFNTFLDKILTNTYDRDTQGLY